MSEQEIPNSKPRGKILVIRGGAIGDFILTLPVLAALREQFPQARLELLGYPHIAQLALAGGLADAVRSIDARSLAGFFARDDELATDLQAYFGGFAIIISFLYDPDLIFQTNVAGCSKAQFIVGPHRPDDGAGVHATEVFLHPLQRLAIFGTSPVPCLKLSLLRSHISPLSSDFQAPLALHPGSGSERKNWPESKWAEMLAALVASTTFDMLLVGGEAEGDRLKRLTAGLPTSRIQIARSLPLVELAELLSLCRAFIGHDSGITHLAAALGLPGIVLWGETAEAVWRPRSERMTVLRNEAGLAQLPVARVLGELARLRGLDLEWKNLCSTSAS